MRSSSGRVCKPALVKCVALTSCANIAFSELDDIVSVHCQSHELIDNALRSYLAFTSEYKCLYQQRNTTDQRRADAAQRNTSRPNMISRAAPLDFWSPNCSMHKRTMFACRWSAVFCRYYKSRVCSPCC